MQSSVAEGHSVFWRTQTKV